MMRVAIIARATLYSVPGGDTTQAVQTARQLAAHGVKTDICLSNEKIAYADYNLLHFFNLTRPADILYHSKKSGKPYVVSTIFCDYSEYDKHHRGKLFRLLPGNSIEYLKTVGRWLLGRDHLASLSYLWLGQRNSIKRVLKNASVLLPNSSSEYDRVIEKYPGNYQWVIIPNGADPALFKQDAAIKKDEKLVLCVARIEGIKNQLNLIKALNNTAYKLVLIGTPAPNQPEYYQQCRELAAHNIEFIDHLPQQELVNYYARAKVHILPSWFETTGLSSLEAGLMGCNLVITPKGDTQAYFGDDAFYCNPGDPQSILRAIEEASEAPATDCLRNKILENYTWQQAAIQTFNAYKSVLYETKDSHIGYSRDTQPLWGI